MAAMDKTRVLLLADHFGYSGGVVHGVTTYYLNVLPRVRRRGVKLRCVFLRDRHPAAEQLREHGVPVEFLGANKWDPFVLGRIEQIARGMEANVLHLVGMKAAVIGRLVARRIGIPVIIHSHDMTIPPLPIRLLYRLLHLHHERGLAVSAAAASYMSRAYGVEKQDVAVLPNGVDVSGIHSILTADRPHGVPDDPLLIAWIGRLHAVKGPQRMIRMMEDIARRLPGAHLLMIGDGPERASCQRLVQELDLGRRVTLLGQRSDVTHILRHVRLVCITSLNEGFSLVAAEAAAAAVPVVAYDVGGLSEVIVRDRTGVLVPDGDWVAFVQAVCRLLNDEPERGRLAAEADRHSNTFSMHHHVDMLIAEYLRASRREAATA
jgi:glycosyltransferase involved in cell wall biosynthesis